MFTKGGKSLEEENEEIFGEEGVVVVHKVLLGCGKSFHLPPPLSLSQLVHVVSIRKWDNRAEMGCIRWVHPGASL